MKTSKTSPDGSTSGGWSLTSEGTDDVRGDARLRVTASAASYRRVRERGKSGRFVARPPDADADDGDGRSLDGTGNVAGTRMCATTVPLVGSTKR